MSARIQTAQIPPRASQIGSGALRVVAVGALLLCVAERVVVLDCEVLRRRYS